MKQVLFSILLATLVLITPQNTFAHCDSVEGPVVVAAKKSLQTGNLNHVLIWVGEDDEAEIRNMFNKVNNVRNINEDVRNLADMYFYETVVRVHRMGEGVGYTGIKNESFKPEEGIEAADIAIEKNSVKDILAHLDEAEHEKVKHYFHELQTKRNFDLNNIEAGRKYVESYVHFIHYVEGLFSGSNEHEHHSKEMHSH
ncbi:MAG: hypothetical protein HND52_08005 [Ignavibacteriae bacterium]|nr:hypothetical protein [Ignavibacteriota bacterium]NOG97891.1 hypothetical protein [Ignavibacteriota bacterium]